MRPKAYRLLVVAGVAYLVALHVIVAALVWQANESYRRNTHLDLGPFDEFEIHPAALYAAFAYYDKIDRLLRKSPVVLLGDSLMQFIPARLAFPRSLNLGLGGITMRDMTASLAYYPSLGQARAVMVSVGINDFCLEHAGEAELAGRIGKLAAALPRNVPLVWSSILPVDPDAPHSACAIAPEVIGRANAAIAQACARLPLCAYSDGYGALADARGHMASRFHGGDGMHLSPQGYEVWLGVLARGLATAEARRR
jgi:lysophospholipase L1-like esterase